MICFADFDEMSRNLESFVMKYTLMTTPTMKHLLVDKSQQDKVDLLLLRDCEAWAMPRSEVGFGAEDQ